MREEIENWMIQAEADIKTTYDCFEDKNYYAAALFAQQVAEKALKAYYIFIKKKTNPKTHNIVKLSIELELPEELQDAARSLAPAYTTSRYPDAAMGPPVYFYMKDNTLPLLKATKVIFEWIKKNIKN